MDLHKRLTFVKAVQDQAQHNGSKPFDTLIVNSKKQLKDIKILWAL